MKQALLVLSLCSCTIPNPWFLIKPNGDDSQGGTSNGMDSSSSRGELESSSAPTTRDPSTTDLTHGESTQDSPTEPVEPTRGFETMAQESTTTVDTTVDTMTQESTTGSSMVSSTGDTTTGEGALVKDLYLLCPMPGIAWWGGKDLNIPRQCNEGSKPGVSQIPLLNINGKDKESILNTTPSIEAMGAIRGVFPFAPLTPDEAMTAKVLTEIHCPLSPDPNQPCKTTAKIIVEVNNVPLGVAESALGDGATDFLQLDLSSVPEVVGGEAFEIVLYVDVGAEASPNDRVYFIRPRVTL